MVGMRIGTWNLQGRWDERHADLLGQMRCDILLLTEVSERVTLPGWMLHSTAGSMAARRRWAAVAAPQDLEPLEDPHGASAMAQVGDLRVCSSILPWRACGVRAPWVGETTAAKTMHAVDAIVRTGPTIWGGDWNHALEGREYAGSKEGRHSILAAVADLGLSAATARQPHQIPSLLAIDHIAVPKDWSVLGTER